MHQVLTQYDILSPIFDYARTETSDHPGRTLLNIALTCKTFFAPSISLLWRRIESIDPVLRLLGAVDVHGKLRILSPITTETWKRSELYLPFVRSIAVRNSQDVIHESVYIHLAPLGRPICPQLRQIDLDSESALSLPISLLLNQTIISASLTTSVYPQDKKESAAMAMSLLATRIPQLQELTTSGHPSKLFVIPLVAFSNLRVLAIRKAIDLPPEFGHVISTLPCLLDLSIILERLPRHWPASDPVIPTQTTCPPGFITLEKLDISGGIAVIDEYLDLISTEASPLRTVSIALFSQSKEALGDPHALYEKVARFETLEEFHIVFKETRRLLSDSAERKITRPALKPLYKLSLLKKFVYEGELSLSDEDVGALVDAWPGLYLLDLHGEVHRQPSYTALSLIAHRCPNFKSLRIPFDFPRETVEITTSEIVDHPLLEFSSYSSVPIHHAAHVARYLDSLFPSLKEVGNWDSGSGWGLVSSIILKACQPVRRDQVIRESRTSFTSAEI